MQSEVKEEETAAVEAEVFDCLGEKAVVREEVEGENTLAADTFKLRHVGVGGDKKSSDNTSRSGYKADLDGTKELDVTGTEKVSAISSADVGSSLIRIFIQSRLSIIFLS